MDIKNRSRILIALMMAAALGTAPVDAQYRDYGRTGLAGGLKIGGLLGSTDLGDNVDVNVRAYLSHGITEKLSGQLGLGYGAISGDEYRTDLGLLDGRFIYHPVQYEKWSPFVYGGLGLLRFDIDQASALRTSDAKSLGWSAIVPLGVGAKVRLTHRLSVDANVGYTYTYRDDLNSASLKKGNDVLWGLKLGIELGADPDPDRDGLLPMVERRYGSHPRRADSDLDGLTDGDEITRFGTSPTERDSDGDGFFDGDEIRDGTDPLVAAVPVVEEEGEVIVASMAPAVSKPVDVAERTVPESETAPRLDAGSTITLTQIGFEPASSHLTSTSRAALVDLADQLASRPDLQLEIQGHTDASGNRLNNLRLSQARAQAVERFLVDTGIETGRLSARGMGPDFPVADNGTATGRLKNRRVELVVR